MLSSWLVPLWIHFLLLFLIFLVYNDIDFSIIHISLEIKITFHITKLMVVLLLLLLFLNVDGGAGLGTTKLNAFLFPLSKNFVIFLQN